MGKKILITGGSGLLALNWAAAARATHTVVLGLHERKVGLHGVEARRIDLESVDGLVRAFAETEPNLVIHTAGMTSVEACERAPELAGHINVDLAANVAGACDRLGLPLVHISTDHVFSGQAANVCETHPLSPVNVYGRTKAEAELRVQQACPQALVVRTNFYGWGPSYRRSFSDTILAALRAGRELTLFQDVFYTPILCEALVHTVHRLLEHKASGVFHVAGDERISKYDFGLRVAEHFSLNPGAIRAGNIVDRADLVPRPREMSLSNEKARGLLGSGLGGVDEQLRRLLQQEEAGLASEMQRT